MKIIRAGFIVNRYCLRVEYNNGTKELINFMHLPKQIQSYLIDNNLTKQDSLITDLKQLNILIPDVEEKTIIQEPVKKIGFWNKLFRTKS
jgi:hypothetical protein